MNLTEKVAYLQGLCEGLELDTDKKEVKVLDAIIDVLADMALSVNDLEDDISQLFDEVDAIDEDLDDLEDYVYDLEDDEEDGCDCGCGCHNHHHGHEHVHLYEITCPVCDEVLTADEDMLIDGDLSCPKCGEKFELEFDEDDEEDGEGEEKE